MAFNNLGRLVSAVIAMLACFGQVNLEAIAILDRPEAYQRKFVTDFLRDGNPTDFVDGYPKTSDHFGDFILLTKYKDWVVPLAETRIIEWLKERESNKQAIENVTGSIAHSGTIQALEFTARVFANQPDYRRWIRQPRDGS